MWLLALAATWVLLGAVLWGSTATQLTNLVMPGIVAALKVKSDRALQRVRDAAPTLSSAAERVVDDAHKIAAAGGRDGTRQIMDQMVQDFESECAAPEARKLLKRMKTIGSGLGTDIDRQFEKGGKDLEA